MMSILKAILFGAAKTTFLFANYAQAETRITVMSFNTQGLGVLQKQSVQQVAAAIKASGADIVGLQETKLESLPEGQGKPTDPVPEFGYGDSNAAALAKVLGWNYVDQIPQKPKFLDAGIWANAVFSKYPIRGVTKNQLGVYLDVDGRKIVIFNIHFNDAPYQPYLLSNIPYGAYPFIKTEAEAIKSAGEARSAGLALLQDEIKNSDPVDAAFVTGDFNEPSFHDWTDAAVKAGNQPLKVEWPTTKAVEAAGFIDALRSTFPDVAAKPAFTWTPTTEPTAKDDHHDRIDFVFAKSPKLKIISAAIVGEKSPEADIVYIPWPSDHRAVTATVEF